VNFKDKEGALRMKKIINSPETVVSEMCEGIALAYPELEYNNKYRFISKKKIDQGKVSLISGGGSGHEPAHAGFIGKGMLDAAVCGDVFASPSQIQVYQAIRATKSEKGTLLIIKNYSGDMMNFKNAAYLAEEDGITVDYVKVDDDIAVQDSLYTVGRRGVAGTVLVHKVTGAAAEMGGTLEQVKAVAELAVMNTKSIGFALSSCTVPAKGTPTFKIEEDEMEYGVGIHGEPGIRREKIVSADELADRTVNALFKELDIKDGNEVTLLINSFGSTPLMELYVLNRAVRKVINEKDVKVYRSFVGNYMTSIDMLGASVTVMKMNDSLKKLLDMESDAPAFKVSGAVEETSYEDVTAGDISAKSCAAEADDHADGVIKDNKVTLNNIVFIVDKMRECIIRNEIPFCELDSYAGDGDFGMSVAKGFRQLKREWNEIVTEHMSSIGDFLNACAMVIMEYCGGASGPIWGSAFRAAGKSAGDAQELDINGFADMMRSAVDGIQKTGERSFGRGAKVGDKTLIDALVPCADAWSICAKENTSIKEAFAQGAKAAVAGAEATKDIVARMGRAGTVGERSLGYPDAGAHALGVIFTEIAEVVQYK
jgi:dihydroxyacetone kinase